MKPRKQTHSGTDELFRSRLENIIDLRHELVRLGERIEWAFFDQAYEAFYSEQGRPGMAAWIGASSPCCFTRRLVAR